jgi:pimeloyl-ACP methyl ester carboxylesterase
LDHGPGELVDHIVAAVSACCSDAAKVHFVTHSLGGILVRAYAAEHAPENLGRVVMLAPPNQGSEYVDAMRDWELFQLAAGPTGVQLGTDPESLPNRLPEPEFELGVIAGTRNSNPISGHVIPGSSDGTVSIESTKLEGMTDFISVDESHTFIMRSPLVAEQTIEFLRNGRFASAGAEVR